ncbi:hypothetical protein CS0771_04650 [Catellatospora sp. IY07-71]|uniref:hypothetical protein n=1 Tax=Catellatospora sp. IY07-71 TaxID=2728827 RepID=UPI001BB3ACD0|nr:hypothetical protein [Catellatospora sp. IY07-71]BCJ70921.1 hypothetical protein CS0771_04650 [Catellatospora sp. IY07-71]
MITGPKGMLPAEGGPIVTGEFALTQWPTEGTTNWTAVDPPRVWDMLRHEDDELGWEQVRGLRALATLLMAKADKLSRHRDALARLWPAEQSKAAGLALQRIDDLIGSMRADSETAIQNALAIDGIMTATAKAKREVQRVVEAWELTTNDGGPEWWDREATRLSYVTEQTMTATERAIRDHRAQITLPTPSESFKGSWKPVAGPEPVKDRTTASGTGRPPFPPTTVAVPPKPGYPPLVTPPSGAGPDLQGITPPVPAVPGQPVSMLPIAPGNPYAPYGGAYVLPGPGVGPSGYVVSLPPPGSNAPATVSGGNRGGSGGMPGMMPMPIGGPAQAASRGEGGGYRRSADTRWQLAHGVAPVIYPDQLSASPAPPAPTPEETEAQFRDWFTQTAMPWRNSGEPDAPAPIVTIRRGASPQ